MAGLATTTGGGGLADPRQRPLVFLSSAIRDLREERRLTKEAIDALGLADPWLFEFHAAASGDPPDVQYLALARTCDLFVLVVADEVSEATWLEYLEAFGDNPSKVLPFLVGTATGRATDERSTLAARHTYVPLQDRSEIPPAVATAVNHAVMTGQLLLGPLDAILQQSAAWMERLLGLPAGVQLTSTALADDGNPTDPSGVFVSESRLVLTGPAGSGKTHYGLQALLRRSNRRSLPVRIKLQRGPTPRLESLVDALLLETRFRAGGMLISQWAAEGRLALVVDGLDELADVDREGALRSIAEFSETYPRSSVVVAVRALAAASLPRFTRLHMAPIPDEDLVSLFRAAGRELRSTRDLPAGLVSFARLPLWAGLLATSGLQARTALELFQGVVQGRIQAILPNEAIAASALHRAIGILALEDQSNPGPAVASCVDALARWLVSPAVTSRYSSLSSEWVLEQASSSGLVGIEAGRVVFAHPLLSACLAAEEVASSGVEADRHRLGSDGRAFLAVLFDDNQADVVLDILAACDVFTLASVARLIVARPRRVDVRVDIPRYDAALGRLADRAGEVAARTVPQEQTSALLSGNFIALRRSSTPEAVVVESDDLTAWASPNEAPTSYTCWSRNPFASETPELLAAAEVVHMFKVRVLALRPAGSRWAPHGANGGELLGNRDDLSIRLLDFVTASRSARRLLLEELNLQVHALAQVETGEPQITIRPDPNDPRFLVEWGHSDSSVVFADADSNHYGESLRVLLTDPAVHAWYELVDELEKELESPLASQSPTMPSRFAEWIL
jgi:Domain of unknown function (DUF4062)